MSRLRRYLPAAVDRGLMQLVRGSGFIFGCRVTGAVLALVTQWALARWMGAGDLGRYLLAYSWCILVARLSGLGYNSAAPRFIGQGIALHDRSVIRGYVTFSTKAVVGLSTLTALIGGSVAYVLVTRSGTDPWPMVIAFAAVPIMATGGILMGIALAYSWFRASYLPSEVMRPALFLGAVTLMWWLSGGLSVTGVMLLQAGSMTAVLVVLVASMGNTLRRGLGTVAPRYEVVPWTRTAAALLIISLFRDYLPELSIIVAGLFLSMEDIAVFTIAYRVASLIAFVLFAVDAFTLPRSAQAQAVGDKAGLQRFVQQGTRVTFFASLGAVIGFWIFGRWALALFGDEFVAGFPLLMMIALAHLIRASLGPVMPLLTMGGYERQCLWVYGAALVLVAPLVTVLATTWGVLGVGAAVASVIIFSSIALNRLVARRMDVYPSIVAAMVGSGTTPRP